jgi:uncharacterized protein YbjT (DUF2867 family)
MTKFLVTGATGNVGRQVVSQLLPGDVRALTRDPETAGLSDEVDVRRGGISDIGTALDGVDAVFLMWPLHTAEPAAEVVDAIKRHARRVVFLSSGAVLEEDNPIGMVHAAVEQAIEESGVEWTHIRPSTFAANALWWDGQIRAGDVVQGIYGEVAMALLHEADMAAVAVRALTEDGHNGKAYTLTGPEVLTQTEQIRILGEVLGGRPLRWQEQTREDARRRLLADDNFPDEFVDLMLDGFAEMLTRPRPTTTTTVEQVTGVPARTFRSWVEDHRAEFGNKTE